MATEFWADRWPAIVGCDCWPTTTLHGALPLCVAVTGLGKLVCVVARCALRPSERPRLDLADPAHLTSLHGCPTAAPPPCPTLQIVLKAVKPGSS